LRRDREEKDRLISDVEEPPYPYPMSENLLYHGDNLDMPAVGQQRATFKQAPKAKADSPEQLALND
jgi:hypothetical protein